MTVVRLVVALVALPACVVLGVWLLLTNRWPWDRRPR